MYTTSTEIFELLQTIQDSGEERQLVVRTKTLFKLLKKDKNGNKNPYGDIWRVATSKITVGKPYTDVVNEVRATEHKPVDFEAQPRRWGIGDGIFVIKGDDRYLRAIFDSSIESCLVNEDGKPIKYQDIVQFISTANTQPKSQGIDEVVQYRNYKLSSIVGAELA